MHDCCHHGICLEQIFSHLLLVPEGQYTNIVVPSKLAVACISTSVAVDPSLFFASSFPLFQMISSNKTAEKGCESCMM